MNAVELASLALVPIAVFDWAVTWVLLRGYRLVPSRQLFDKLRAAALIAGGTTIYAVLVLATRLVHLPIDPLVVGALIIAAAALPSVSNLAWLIDFLRGKFAPAATPPAEPQLEEPAA